MYIKTITLENIKRFEGVTLDFQRPDGSFAGWNTIVGGNSSGKSTFLKAMALVLAGPETTSRLDPKMNGWLTQGAKSGRVDLTLLRDTNLDTIVERGKFPDTNLVVGLRWIGNPDNQPASVKPVEDRSKSRAGESRIPAMRGPWNPAQKGWFFAGYGPMRRLSGSAPDAMRYAAGGGKAARTISLFREDVALSESEEWLKNQKFKALEKNPDSEALVDQVIAFLNDGLLPNNFTISGITSEHVNVETGPGGPVLPMRDISDGYRSIYALILDIIHSFGEVFGMDSLFSKSKDGKWIIDKPGVILIDEIEAHLHPSWQKTISIWFKERFPKIQFFITTHSPLIVQASDPGGIYVLPMPSEIDRKPRRLDDHEFKRIVLGRAEKVLLGEAFNLHETRGQWATNEIDRWKELSAKQKAGVQLSVPETTQMRLLGEDMKMIFEEGL